jgi:hypothetical protein
MALFTGTQQQYYTHSQSFTGNGSTTTFTLTFSPLPTAEGEFAIYFDDTEQNNNLYTYNNSTGVITFTTAPGDGVAILVKQVGFDEELGNYQFIRIRDIIDNFIIGFVGEGKIIPKLKRTDASFHAQRAFQELSYDTLRAEKSQEVEMPSSLSIKMPHDYVNYIKLTWKDSSGVEKLIHPIKNSSNPTAIIQNSDGGYTFDADGNLLKANNSDTQESFKTASNEVNSGSELDKDYPDLHKFGRRYGIDPSATQNNGWFYADVNRGMFYFSDGLSGKTITLKYISDSLGTEAEMKVHKFAEDAVYKYMAHAILATNINSQEYLVNRFKREKFAAIRQAKLRLSNLKSEELAQIMRGKSKWIKH